MIVTERLLALGLAAVMVAMVPASTAVVGTTLAPSAEPSLESPGRTGPDTASSHSFPTFRETPERFEVFDDTVTSFMAERGIDAGALALVHDGELQWSQGYGYLSDENEEKTRPSTPFRLASITKTMTAAAIYQLQATGQLSLQDHVFCPLDEEGPHVPSCHLTIRPPEGQQPDPRIFDVVIDDLLLHEGGWDREISGDPMFDEIEIANALGVDSPPGLYNIARYMMGQPLDFDPGTRSAYSNFGYALLGMVIENVTGNSYEHTIQENVFLGMDRDPTFSQIPFDIYLGRTLPEDRNPREPEYHCGYKTENVFNPVDGFIIDDPDEWVCAPNGGWHHEAHLSAGGMVANAPTVAWFAERYLIPGYPVGSFTAANGATAEAGFGLTYWFYGSLPGTATLVREHPDGYVYAALFDQRYDSDHGRYTDTGVIRDELDDAVETYDEDRGPVDRMPIPSVPAS